MKRKPSLEEMQFKRKEENCEKEELRTAIIRMKLFRTLAASIKIKMKRICKQIKRPWPPATERKTVSVAFRS